MVTAVVAQGTFLVEHLPADAPWQVHHIMGLMIWLSGWVLVVQADGILRGLRKPNETGELHELGVIMLLLLPFPECLSSF